MGIIKLAANLVFKLFGVTLVVYTVLNLTPGSLKAKIDDLEGQVVILRNTGKMETAVVKRRLIAGDAIEVKEGYAKLVYVSGLKDSVDLRAGETHRIGNFRSMVEGYGSWVGRLLRGDWGYVGPIPIVERLTDHAVRSLLLMAGGLGLSLILASGMALVTVLLPRNILGTNLIGLTNLISGIHVIVLAYAVYLFGWAKLNSGFSLWMFVLLALGSGALIDFYALLRQQLRMAFGHDYISAAKGRGSSMFKHAFFNEILIGVVESSASRVPALIGGTIIVEWIFAWQGLGFDIVLAVRDRDFDMLMGITVVVSLILLSITELTDLVRRRLDPRLF
jgi:peptide/nickel transport system permease protein